MRKVLALILLLLLLLPTTALAAEEGETVYEVYTADSMTSGPLPLTMVMSLDDGVLFESNSTDAKWIDRLDIGEDESNPVRAFYRLLEEATDNDGEDDFLIDDAYFDVDSYGNGNFAGRAINIGNVTYYTYPLPQIIFAAGDAGEASSKKSACTAFYSAAWFAFDRDHPEVFWLEGGISLLSTNPRSNGDGTYTTDYWLTLMAPAEGLDARDYSDANNTVRYNESSIKAGITTIHEAWAEISGTDEYAVADTDYKKIKVFNNWLTKNCGYNTYVANGQKDLAPESAWQCISALTKQYGTTGPVCEAYARAFKFLCDKVDIPCVLVDGNAITNTGAGPHMWNYVSVDKGVTWHAVDVTWNDPSGGSDSSVSGYENEDYLLVGGQTMNGGRRFLESHPVSDIPDGGGKYDFPNGPVLADQAYVDMTITFDPNGGSVTPTSAKPSAVGKLITLPEPTRKGYKFLGWYTAASGGDPVTTETVFSASATIYAHWEALEYEILEGEQLTIWVGEVPQSSRVLLVSYRADGYMVGISKGTSNAEGDWEFPLANKPESAVVKLIFCSNDFKPVGKPLLLK